MGYEEHGPTAAIMGYETAAPTARRGSMSAGEATQRRASIKAIMADGNISPLAKRRSIQHLMDGRRTSMNGATNVTSPAAMESSIHSGSTCSPCLSDADVDPYGCGSQTSSPHNAPPHSSFICNDQTKWAEQSRPVCTHYDRKCTLLAPCCGAAFGCRICHDDCPVLPPKINNGGRRFHRSTSLPSSFTSMEQPVAATVADDPRTNHHTIDRFTIREVICRECFARQSSKTYVHMLALYPATS